MGISLDLQTTVSLSSVIFAIAVGIEYDLFRIFRLLFPFGKWAVFFEDLIFFILCAFEFFLFCFFFNNGEIRLYSVLICLLSWLIYYLTAGNFIYGKIKKTVTKFRRRGGGDDSAI